MQVFQITLHFQSFKDMADLPCERLRDLMQAQSYLPLYELPDQSPESSSLSMDFRQVEIYLSCTVKAARRTEVHLRLSALADLLQSTLSKELDEPSLEISGFVSLDVIKMPMDLVLKGPDGLFAVYRAGAIYALGDGIPSVGLQDPMSPLFQPGGLRRLDARETWQLLNSAEYETCWSRREALLRGELKGDAEPCTVAFKPAASADSGRKASRRAA